MVKEDAEARAGVAEHHADAEVRAGVAEHHADAEVRAGVAVGHDNHIRAYHDDNDHDNGRADGVVAALDGVVDAAD